MKASNWIIDELETLDLGDLRLEKRCISLVNNISRFPDKSIYASSSNPSFAKAAYRFLDNPRFDEQDLHKPHRDQLAKRASNVETILSIQDSTNIDLTNLAAEDLLPISKNQNFDESMKGFFLHAALVTNDAGLPLGIDYVDFFGNDPLPKRDRSYKNRPIEEKKSYRWLKAANSVRENIPNSHIIHICDREADIYEFLQLINDTDSSDFVVRLSQNRRTIDKKNILEKIKHQRFIGHVELTIRDGKNNIREVEVGIKALSAKIKPPQRLPGAKSISLQPICINILHIKEKSSRRDKIDWLILTSLDISSIEEALEVIRLYGCRWGIEEFFKVLKYCFRVQEAQFGYGENHKKYIILKIIASHQLYFMNMLSRSQPNLRCDVILERAEWTVLCRISSFYKRCPSKPPPLYKAITAIAMLGGYWNRANDPPPGNLVLARGWEKLQSALILYHSMVR